MTNNVYGAYRRQIIADAWTEERIRALGMVCDIETAAQIIGIARSTAYRMVRSGTFPAQTKRVGRVYRVTVASLLAYLTGPDQEHE